MRSKQAKKMLEGQGGWHINSRCGHKIYDDCERGISTAAIDKVGKAQNGVATFVRLWPLNSPPESGVNMEWSASPDSNLQ